MGLAIEEGLCRIDAFGFEHVVAHRRLNEHGKVAARGDGDGRLRHLGIENFAVAVVAGNALEPGIVAVDALGGAIVAVGGSFSAKTLPVSVSTTAAAVVASRNLRIKMAPLDCRK